MPRDPKNEARPVPRRIKERFGGRSVEGVEGSLDAPATGNVAYLRGSEPSVEGVEGVEGVLEGMPPAGVFPIEALPGALRRLSVEVALSIKCAPDFAALPGLVVLGAAIGNSRRVRWKGSWTESSQLFGATVAVPGAAKTPGLRQATAPAKEAEMEAGRDFGRQRDEYELELERWDHQKRQAIKDGEEIPLRPEEVTQERTWVSDPTVEALAPILKENRRGLVLARGELSGWFRGLNQFKGGKGSDRSFYLERFDLETINPDRATRKIPSVNTPFLSICGTVQPEVIQELAGDTNDGMLDRFLFTFPDLIEQSWTDEVVSPEAVAAYQRLYEKLRALNMPLDDHGDPDPPSIELSPEAKDQRDRVHNKLAAEQIDPGLPPKLSGIWAKFRTYLARLTLVLALSRCVEGGQGERVEEEDVLAAEKLMDYFAAHAKRIHVLINGRTVSSVLLSDLYAFVKASGGEWKGATEELHQRLESEVKPARSAEFAKMLSKLQQQSTGVMDVQIKKERWPTSKDNSRSVTTLKLTPTDNALNALNALNESLSEGTVGGAQSRATKRDSSSSNGVGEQTVFVEGGGSSPSTPSTNGGGRNTKLPDDYDRLVEERGRELDETLADLPGSAAGDRQTAPEQLGEVPDAVRERLRRKRDSRSPSQPEETS